MQLDSFDFDFLNDGFATFIGYGKEKGNSQLDIIQSTGIIGFLFYLAMLFSIAIQLINLFLNVKERNYRVQLGIISGVFFGMIGHSAFEGWWGSLGAPETIYFWILVGVILGMEAIMNVGNTLIEKPLER